VDGTELASTVRHEDLVTPCGLRSAPRAHEPFDVRCTVGRLVELRLFELSLPDEVTALSVALGSAAAPLGSRAVVLADYRRAGPFPHGVGDAWSRAMRRSNQNVLRSAALLDPANETFNLQIARVIRCAGLPARRWFNEVDELRAWLADVLTEGERARLDAFLGG
jgi:hypothetical protein